MSAVLFDSIAVERTTAENNLMKSFELLEMLHANVTVLEIEN